MTAVFLIPRAQQPWVVGLERSGLFWYGCCFFKAGSYCHQLKGFAVSPIYEKAVQACQAGEWAHALHLCDRLLEDKPLSAQTLHLKAVALMTGGFLHDALHTVEAALSLEAGNPVFYNTLGILFTELDDLPKALDALKQALKNAPEYADAHCNAGRVLIRMGRYEEAVAVLTPVVNQHPYHATAHANLALGLHLRGDTRGALARYQTAISLQPGNFKWRYNTGVLHMQMENFQEAVAVFERLSTSRPDDLAVLGALGVAYRALGRLDQSIASFEKIRAQVPDHPQAAANLAVAYRYVCDWQKAGQMDAIVQDQTQKSLLRGQAPEEQPLLNIMRLDDPEINVAVARLHSRDIAARRGGIDHGFTFARPRRGDARITIGYLSGDFRNHPVAHQMVRLYALHERSRYRILCFSTGPDDKSSFRRDIAGSCDRFFDLRHLPPRSVAETINDHNVDILVDLGGHTHGNQLAVSAHRPAPVQAAYLGFLASTGADFIDYLIADKLVVPEAHARFYTEKLVWMPDCYQISNNRQPIGPGPVDRRSNSLPKDCFVFCCFNQSYKIDASVFAVWMKILHQVPDSVLWLYDANPTATANLIAAAEKAGVAAKRLVFAPKLPLNEHLSRLGLADLALDTFRYNGGATTANALFAGVPVVAKLGGHFVSRMSASNLAAAGLPELIVRDEKDYERLAVLLARTPRKLSRIKARLARARNSARLFDTEQFVVQLEKAYAAMWQRYVNGEMPKHIDLELSDGIFQEADIRDKKRLA